MSRSRDASWRHRPGLLVGVCVLVYLPFCLLGYGNDSDVANVLRAGRSSIEDGDYQVSRGPGAAIHEVATAALDRVGGSVLVDLASVAFAGLALWCAYRLVDRDRGRWPAFAVLLIAANPWFWIAATSLGDFVWALGLLLAGAVAAQADRRVLAGLLFGLAVGCRASTALLVVAWLVAEAWPDGTSLRPRWRDLAVTAAVAAAVGIACFVPPWLDAGRSLGFIENELDFAGLRVHLGRWVVKNLAVAGVVAAVVLLVGFPRWIAALRRWRSSQVVRFAVLMVLVSEVVFLRFPFKPAHLLPVVAGMALFIASSERATQAWLTALVVAQLVAGLVGVTLARPDVPDAASTGRVQVSVVAGPLVADVRCRLDDRERGAWPDEVRLEATERAHANAACLNEAWRGG